MTAAPETEVVGVLDVVGHHMLGQTQTPGMAFEVGVIWAVACVWTVVVCAKEGRAEPTNIAAPRANAAKEKAAFDFFFMVDPPDMDEVELALLRRILGMDKGTCDWNSMPGWRYLLRLMIVAQSVQMCLES